jgi:endonuclease/exonuclease/phosphatase family metal-dependent hydrolase
MRLRIATFNVAGLPSALAPLRRRAPLFCQYLQDVDVLNLQEVWTARALATVRAHLPAFPHVAGRRGGLATLSRHPFAAMRYTSFRRATARGPAQWVNTRRIDYALVRGRKVTGCATLFERPDENHGHLSDHVALTVDVEV